MLAVPGIAPAVVLNFTCITQNNSDSCAIGEAQLGVDVTAIGDPATGGTSFLFTNIDNNNLTLFDGTDPDPVIAEIYFDADKWFTTDPLDGSEPPGTFNLAFVGKSQGANVSFSTPNLPGTLDPNNLPGGNPIGFVADFGTEADGNTDTGINEGGVPAGEWVNIMITRLPFDIFMMALNEGSFNIGLHVRSFETMTMGQDGKFIDYSESFVLNPNPIPVPAAFWLFGTALIGFIGLSRRTRV